MNYYEEIGNIIAEILSVWEKAECYEELANNSLSIFTLNENNIFWDFLFKKIEKLLFELK